MMSKRQKEIDEADARQKVAEMWMTIAIIAIIIWAAIYCANQPTSPDCKGNEDICRANTDWATH
jgi:hypothetical protein